VSFNPGGKKSRYENALFPEKFDAPRPPDTRKSSKSACCAGGKNSEILEIAEKSAPFRLESKRRRATNRENILATHTDRASTRAPAQHAPRCFMATVGAL
jgi:hypothetical protein